MDTLIERLPDIITAAAQSYLGILALLSISLSILAYLFFSKASEKIRLGVFVLLFFGVIGFAMAMFQVSPSLENSNGAGVDSPAALSEEAKTLLREVARDPSGLILYPKYGASVELQTNDKILFTEKFDHRAMAAWDAALQQLVREGLLTARGERQEVFEITNKGYEVAEHL